MNLNVSPGKRDWLLSQVFASAMLIIMILVIVPDRWGKNDRLQRTQWDINHLVKALHYYHIAHNRYPSVPTSHCIQEASALIGGKSHYLTTPVAFLFQIPSDVFAMDGRNQSYRYYSDEARWFTVLGNGPDGDIDITDALFQSIVERSNESENSGTVLLQSAMVFDPSNGTTSNGDIVRIGH